MQLIHSITLTSLVVIGTVSTVFHHREKPLRDVAAVSALLATVAAAKLAHESKREIITAFSKGIWGYLSIL